MLHRKDKSYVNMALVLINVAVFILMEVNGGSSNPQLQIGWGAAYTPLIAAGETWRLFTCMFLHSGLRHLLSNMLLLFFMGDYVERYMGRIRYLLLYLGGGTLASWFSYQIELAQGEEILSVGASGAIFAVMAAMLVLVLIHRGKLEDLTLPRVVLMIVLSLWVGFQTEGVDAMAHLGGFLGGCLLSLILLLPEVFRNTRKFDG